MSYRRRRCLLFVLATSAFALTLPGWGQPDSRRKKYALLVGVKEYDHARFPDLRYTENDAEELARLLAKDFTQVVVLTTSRGRSSASAAPTARNIRAELKRLLAKLTKHDTILIALAGHGVQLTVKTTRDSERGEAFFCPADAKLKDTKDRKELSKTMIGLAELFQDLADSGAGVKLLLVDACRDDPKTGRNVDVNRLPRPPRGCAALFSCASGQRAFETNKLGKKGHGIFFHFVLEGLRGEARNKEGEVTWDELATYVKRQVSRTVPRIVGDGAQQSPHLVADLVGEPPVLLKAPPPTPDDLPKEIINSLGMKLKRIPAGRFTMGSPLDEADRKDEEVAHSIEITKPFYMAAHEVTQAWYFKLMKDNPSYFSKDGAGNEDVAGLDTGSFPVDSVTWEDAVAFCKALTDLPNEEKKEGRRYRLPTEAEWEYACRGGRESVFHFGAALTPRQANVDRRLGRTAPVGRFKTANAFGLFDMHGNVAEWCSDRYDKGWYRDSPAQNPAGPKRGDRRVLRGGSWESPVRDCRSAARRGFDPTARNVGFGFRVVCDPGEKPSH